MKDYPAFVVGLVQKGEIMLSQHQKKTLNTWLQKHEGQYARLTFSKQEKGRSMNQNNYYWGIVLTFIAEETGHTTEEIHEYMKAMFLPRCFLRIGKSNKEQQIIKSTTTLTTMEFESYLDHIRSFAATELNMVIPLPHETLSPS